MLRKFLILIFIGLSGSVLAQDPEFTQFYANPLYLNPAFAGSVRCPRVALNYRNQWPALTGTFVTSSASYDQHVEALGGGTLTTTNISAIYSYQLNINREFSIKFGMQGTYAQKKVDWDKLTFGDMIDPRFGFIYQTQETRPNENKSFWDFSAGILGYSNRYYGGVAVNHLTEPQEFYIKAAEGSNLPMKSFRLVVIEMVLLISRQILSINNNAISNNITLDSILLKLLLLVVSGIEVVIHSSFLWVFNKGSSSLVIVMI